MAVINTGDGRSILLSDDLTEEEIQNEINSFVTNFPLPVIEEKVLETTPLSEEILPVETSLKTNNSDEALEIYKNIQNLKTNRQSALDLGQSSYAYDEKIKYLEKDYEDAKFGIQRERVGDNFFKQVEAGILGLYEGQTQTFGKENSFENIADLTNKIETLKLELTKLNDKEQSEVLSEDEKRKQQEIYKLLEGTGDTEIPTGSIYGRTPNANMFARERKDTLGLIKYRDDLVNTNVSVENEIKDIELSDAFMHVLGEGLKENPRAISSFLNDLTATERTYVMRDVLGRSAAATTAILGTSFGIASLTRGLGAVAQFGAQFLGTGGVSGEIEYSHSFVEYLKTKGMDISNPESIVEFMDNEEIVQEARKYAATKGMIIGGIDGVTGGIATRIIAPAVITRTNRGVMKYINPSRAEGQTLSPSTRHAINFAAQTPLQTGLPAGAEYFAQLATLEEGERISTGEVFFEALGEAAFIPADMALGIYSTNKEIGFTKAQQAAEGEKRTEEQLQISKARARQEGLGDIAGEIYKGKSGLLIDTGVPYFEQANEIYQNNINDISLYADTNFNVTAPNQFKVKPTGDNQFLIIDTFGKKIGNVFDLQTEAIGVSGALNLISGAFYSKQQKEDAANIQGLNTNVEENPFLNRLGNSITNPYFGQLDMVDVSSSPNINFAAYERLTNAIGKDATHVDVLSLQGVLPEADINRLLDLKAKKYYSEANIDKKLPNNITIKMIENLGKKLNLDIDTTSNGFKSLSLKLTGEPNVNKQSNTQKRLVYSFLNTLPQHEGSKIGLPDFSPRSYTIKEYNQVVDSLNSGKSPTLPNIISALGLNPNNPADKRTATRLRQDLVFAGIVNKKGSKYNFNVNGEWSLNRAQQVAIDSDPQTKIERQEIEKFRSVVVSTYENIGMPEIATKLDNAIKTRLGQINSTADGQFDPVWSEIFLSLAKAKEGTTNEQEVLENLTLTLGHELFHAAKFLDLFSIQEINNLNNTVRNDSISEESAKILLKENFKILKNNLGRLPTYFEAIEFRYNTLDNQNLNNQELLEEASATLFEDYIRNRKKLSLQPKNLMERTKKLFTSINNGFNELGFQTYEDVFDRFVSGEVGQRERINNKTKPSRVERIDQYGINQGSYEIQTPVIRTNRILENEFSELIRRTETSIGNEYYPESADRDLPTFERPLQDAPNLKFKLANVQQRPTSLTQEYWRGAQNEEYGNDLNQIAETIFAKNIVNNNNVIRRLGRLVENSEVAVTQNQLNKASQTFLTLKNYPDEFPVYVIGDLSRGTTGTVTTNNLEEAVSIANEFVDPPFQILGDRKKITKYTITKPKVILDKDVMFGAKPPAFAQPTLASTDFLIVGSSSLSIAPSQPVTYQAETPPQGIVRRKLNLGLPKTKFKMSGLEFMSQKSTRGKQVASNLRVYGRSVDRIGQATLEEKTLAKKLKLSEPLDDIAFANSKKDLLELMNQGVDVLELADHPASVEGMSRMSELQTTADQFLNRLGEEWFLDKSYINNRKFIINNKSVSGIRNAIAESIKKAESYSVNPVPNNKQAWLVLGATASGKSYYSELLAKENNLAIVDSDDIKKIIPEYKGGVGANAVHTESRLLTSEVRRELMDQGKNILLPRVGGLAKQKEILSLIQEFKEEGYEVKTVFVDTDYKTALGRMYKRFAKTGRLVPPSYIEEVQNTPTDTFHRVKYVGDGYAWIDNNGEQNQQTIRQDSGILPTSLFSGGRDDVRRIRRESSEEAVSSFTSEEQVTIEEAIEGVKGINDRLVSAGFLPKFNLNSSPDALLAAYVYELNKDNLSVIPDNLKPKYSLKDRGSKFTEDELNSINRITIREEYRASNQSLASALLETLNGYLTQDNIMVLRENIVDQYARFEPIEKAAFERRGQTEAEITADVSMISALRFQERSSEVFKSVIMEGVPVYDEKGFVRAESISPITGKPITSLFEAFEPAFKDQDLFWAFQFVRIAGRETRFDNEGKPTLTTDAERKEAKALLGKYPEIQKMSDAYDEFDLNMVKFLVDTGVITEATSKNWLAHSDYFPFYRQIGVDEKGNQLVKGPKVFQNIGVKNIFVTSKGSSETKITDPMSAITQNVRAAITLGMKNVAANRVIRDMVDTGFAVQVPLNRANKNTNVVTIRVAGESKAFEIPEQYPQIFEAFQNFENGSFMFNSFVKYASVPKKILSGLITRFPSFWIKQIERDSISAHALLGGKFPPIFTSLSNWIKTWTGMTLAKLPLGVQDDVFAQGFSRLKKSGVISGYDTVASGMDDTNDLINALYKKNNVIRKGFKGLGDATLLPFLKLWELSGEGTITSDAGTRLAVYDAVLKKTNNEAEAVYQAMQVLDFTRRGKAMIMQFFGTVIPFLNPRLQGVDVFSRALTGSYGQSGLTKKQRQKNTLFRLGALMSLAPFYYFAVKDSEEYKEATDHQRDNYFIFPGSKKLTGEILVWSKPFEVGLAFFTIPERIMRWGSGDETIEKTAKKIFSNVATTLAIDPRQITAINPILEVATNYDFYTGEPIVSNQLKDKDAVLQYRPSTNNLFVQVGKELNVSPLYVENLWTGYTGTMGMYFASVADSATREYFGIGDRPAMQKSEKPLTSAFFLPKENRGLEEVFYEFKSDINNMLVSMKENERRKLEMGDKQAEKISPEYSLEYINILENKIKELNGISETLSKFKTTEDRIRNTTFLDADQKLKQINFQKQKTNLLLKNIREDRMNWERGQLKLIKSP